MMTQTVWAAETFANGHFSTIEGGLSRDAALAAATKLALAGERAQIAEYTTAEGTSAISRQAMAYQVQVRTADGEWVQAGPDAIGTLGEAEAEREHQVETGADVDGRDVHGDIAHNGVRIVVVEA